MLETPFVDEEPPSGVVLIAASAGGIRAVPVILSSLPTDLSAAIVIVQHRTATLPSMLPDILQRTTRMPTKEMRDGERLRRGFVYVAPPDRHARITPQRRLRLVDGQRIRHVLSSANPLFESGADVYRDHVVAIVLTGGDHDGTDGVQAVAAHGGVVVAQDPATAQASSMPSSAIRTGVVGHVLPLDAIGPFVTKTVAGWH